MSFFVFILQTLFWQIDYLLKRKLNNIEKDGADR